MTREFDNFDDLVGDMKEHIRKTPDSNIVENDDVLGLKIKYEDQNTGDSWAISTADFYKWTKTLQKGHGDLIRRAFQTSEGKKALLDIIKLAR